MKYWARRAACLIADAYEGQKAYWRGLIVRAIEDAAVLLIMIAGIWMICTVSSGILTLLGVGA